MNGARLLVDDDLYRYGHELLRWVSDMVRISPSHFEWLPNNLLSLPRFSAFIFATDGFGSEVLVGNQGERPLDRNAKGIETSGHDRPLTFLLLCGHSFRVLLRSGH